MDSKDINDISIKDISYHILPAKRLFGSSFSRLHDEVFSFFVHRWEQTFEETKDIAKPAPGWEDHFLKQDIVTAITCRGQVVAAHLYTVYDITAASTKKSEYFSFMTPSTVEGLLQNGIHNVISMEYLCVDPSVRLNSLAVSFGKMIVGLGAYLAMEKGLDGALGTPMKGNKVDTMMTNVGGYWIQKDFQKYGYQVDLLVIPTRPCERSQDPKAGFVMEWLWEHRKDHTKEYFLKVAA
jgi:hypothetical protein